MYELTLSATTAAALTIRYKFSLNKFSFRAIFRVVHSSAFDAKSFNDNVVFFAFGSTSVFFPVLANESQ